LKIKAQIAMVINLDKCIGCHTCSVTCKNTWTNREGAEYMWFNNVETKPGIGYPMEWENQEKYKGGWELKDGKLRLKGGSRLAKLLLKLFHNPDMPTLDDYYEPWTYDYEKLINSPTKRYQPVARPKSVITGKNMDLKWGPNWEDDLAGAHQTGTRDPNVVKMQEKVKFEFEQTFMAYLPRLCEHCLNPGCVAACPSGAIYKREEDGIVLVDQDACRSWRMCMTGCPYKKVYFNWQTHKAEKCIFCFPRVESGQPTVCSETCSGRVRYMGVILYDADRVKEAASTSNEQELYQAQLSVFLDPTDPEVIAKARLDGIREDWLEDAKRSPIYDLAVRYGIALPLHPEFRTMPMVWYIPPLSPIVSVAKEQGVNENLFPLLDDMRIPIEYLANILTAGNTKAVKSALGKLLAMRTYMRSINTNQKVDKDKLREVGLDEIAVERMYRLLAIAKYEDRFVIPTSHQEKYVNVYKQQGSCGYSLPQGSSCYGIRGEEDGR
jgi:nitrate reductase beta subunit